MAYLKPKNLNKNRQCFVELLKAGLWGDLRSVQEYKGFMVQDSVDWNKVYQLAQEQSVQGIVLRGIEELKAEGLELSVPRVLLLQWIGEVRVIEQQNKDMNAFVAELFGRLREAGINALLVKGQGIAQCYEKPLWRMSGDVDLLLDAENYEKAKALLLPLTSDVEPEFVFLKHLGMTISGWTVELHGSLRPRLTKKIDGMVEALQKEVHDGGKVRLAEFGSPNGSKVQVALPAPDEDVLFVFCHILQHFYYEGVGLRQICDWCRLLYTYRDSLDHGLLESRIRKAGLMTEWKAFGAMAVKYLGMNPEDVPFLGTMFNVASRPIAGAKDNDSRLDRKADWIMEFILEVGNFGHSREHATGQSFLKDKLFTLRRRTVDSARHFMIFPKNAFRIWLSLIAHGAATLFERSPKGGITE